MSMAQCDGSGDPDDPADNSGGFPNFDSDMLGIGSLMEISEDSALPFCEGTFLKDLGWDINTQVSVASHDCDTTSTPTFSTVSFDSGLDTDIVSLQLNSPLSPKSHPPCPHATQPLLPGMLDQLAGAVYARLIEQRLLPHNIVTPRPLLPFPSCVSSWQGDCVDAENNAAVERHKVIGQLDHRAGPRLERSATPERSRYKRSHAPYHKRILHEGRQKARTMTQSFTPASFPTQLPTPLLTRVRTPVTTPISRGPSTPILADDLDTKEWAVPSCSTSTSLTLSHISEPQKRIESKRTIEIGAMLVVQAKDKEGGVDNSVDRTDSRSSIVQMMDYIEAKIRQDFGSYNPGLEACKIIREAVAKSPTLPIAENKSIDQHMHVGMEIDTNTSNLPPSEPICETDPGLQMDFDHNDFFDFGNFATSPATAKQD